MRSKKEHFLYTEQKCFFIVGKSATRISRAYEIFIPSGSI
jgi:hypothetical protein